MTTLLSPNVKVHLALGFINMRKGIDGLAMLVQGVAAAGSVHGTPVRVPRPHPSQLIGLCRSLAIDKLSDFGLEDLAIVAFRQTWQKSVCLRPFEAGDVFDAESIQFPSGDGPRCHDKGDNLLTPIRMTTADNARLDHGRMAQQHFLDFPRIDVGATRDDNVLGAILQIQEAVRVKCADVAGPYLYIVGRKKDMIGVWSVIPMSSPSIALRKAALAGATTETADVSEVNSRAISLARARRPAGSVSSLRLVSTKNPPRDRPAQRLRQPDQLWQKPGAAGLGDQTAARKDKADLGAPGAMRTSIGSVMVMPMPDR